MPYHGNQRNQPQCNRDQPPQVHCDRYDDVVDLITQVELVEKTNFSYYANQARAAIAWAAIPKQATNTDKTWVFAASPGCLKNRRMAVRRDTAGLPGN